MAPSQQKAPAVAGALFTADQGSLLPIALLLPVLQRSADGNGRWWRQPCDQWSQIGAEGRLNEPQTCQQWIP